jgi:hypothetical protein
MNITSNSPRNRDAAAAFGAMEAAVVALGMHGNNPNVAEVACGALKNMVAHHEVSGW